MTDERDRPAAPAQPAPRAPAQPTQTGGPLAPSEGERQQAARARGLSAPYIGGGRDPNPEAGAREDRFYGRLLLAMVLVIVIGGFILGVVANVLGLFGLAAG